MSTSRIITLTDAGDSKAEESDTQIQARLFLMLQAFEKFKERDAKENQGMNHALSNQLELMQRNIERNRFTALPEISPEDALRETKLAGLQGPPKTPLDYKIAAIESRVATLRANLDMKRTDPAKHRHLSSGKDDKAHHEGYAKKLRSQAPDLYLMAIDKNTDETQLSWPALLKQSYQAPILVQKDKIFFMCAYSNNQWQLKRLEEQESKALAGLEFGQPNQVVPWYNPDPAPHIESLLKKYHVRERLTEEEFHTNYVTDEEDLAYTEENLVRALQERAAEEMQQRQINAEAYQAHIHYFRQICETHIKILKSVLQEKDPLKHRKAFDNVMKDLLAKAAILQRPELFFHFQHPLWGLPAGKILGAGLDFMPAVMRRDRASIGELLRLLHAPVKDETAVITQNKHKVAEHSPRGTIESPELQKALAAAKAKLDRYKEQLKIGMDLDHTTRIMADCMAFLDASGKNATNVSYQEEVRALYLQLLDALVANVLALNTAVLSDNFVRAQEAQNFFGYY